MKLTGKTIDRFLAKPDPQVMAVLVYGVDAGLVRERANQLVRQAAGSLDDPFRVAALSGKILREDPARLADEAMAMSLTGGRRAVRIEDADDDVAPILKSYLAGAASGPATDSLIVLEAEELPARSALRKLCEGADQAAALPCYRDEGAGLSGLIREKLQQEGLAIAPEALSYLAARLGGDRAVTVSELEKLALYMGGTGKTVALADVEAAVGDSAAHALDDLVYALSDRDTAGVERGLARSLGEGTAPISLLRAAARHFLRLQWALGKADQGGIEGAMRSLRPPVFFKYEDRFKGAARRWSPAGIATALERLLATEQLCKRSGSPAETLCRRVFLEIASLKPGR
ncbi:MAG TPA: DNA polymerase III subunit delta [Hypericibacter adhaerens]|jgi:DNA polymerase-3 subunit delta|uniref:DNA-directed DNA polymerase n=1 Tax=Hypericibacter adhaerens TaxID=2602016 RepID=A0A5J6NAZ9_9PROT|nr:DNA polymerase III subunit delta [Hypericibacter adhaerens]QEX25116.1 DNA polymerase III subunit delta [Hypericibacter adhaerens]HWA45717.1 DNA polymerase III subunit delta [Hypericibacter adhaerens]